MSLAKRLLDAEATGRLGHALLIELQEEDSSQWRHDFIHPLLCENFSQLTPQACGHCDSCVMLTEPNPSHPDFVILRPEGEKGFVLEDLEDVSRVAYRRSSLSPRRVLWISQADRLQGAPANSLLKGIEEPRDGVLWILTASQPLSVMNTLRSRCQHFRRPYAQRNESTAQTGADPHWLSLQNWLREGAQPSPRFRPLPMDRADYWKERDQRLLEWDSQIQALWAALRPYWHAGLGRRSLWCFDELFDFCRKIESYGNAPLHWSVTRKRLGWGG